MKVITALTSFIKESKAEAKKVDWPTKEKTAQNTILVVVFGIVTALFLGAVDLVFVTLLERFIL
ncbi:MAG: preprotein translocase subunit SecE [Candidatus Wildermuthbacteria bacterium]|nr:preprotein translocase subunit SecE [Candidatus Wildermuthbacteria bacterium]